MTRSLSASWARFGALALAFMLLLTCLPLAAQERYGSLTGVATDASGAVLGDVNITATNTSTGRTYTAKTRSDGYFAIPDLEPGRYNVVFEKGGFARYEAKDASILLGRATNVQAQMKVGAVDQTIEVTGQAAAVDTTSTLVATNVTIEEIDRLPKGRNFQGVSVLAPSVNTGQIEGGFQINGASAAENNYYIDGVSTSSIIDGSARQSATFDYLQEVQVKTTGIDAEYGGALGGVVTAVTKSGGNDFHGEGHWYYYGSKLSSGPPKRLAILDPVHTVTGPDGLPMQLNDPSQAAYFQDSESPRSNNEVGGSLGGPILKNKLWFYTSASPRYLRQRVDYALNSGNRVFDIPFTMQRSFTAMNWFSKISWDPFSRVHTNFSWLYTPSTLTGSLPAYNEYGPNYNGNALEDLAPLQARGFFQPEQSVTGQVDFTITNSSILSVKGGRYYLNYKDTGVPYKFSNRSGSDTTSRTDLPEPLRRSLLASTPTAAQTIYDITTRNYVQADFSQSAKFIGTHNFKVGVGTMKNINSVNDATVGPLGRVTMFFDAAPAQTGIRGDLGYYTVDDLSTRGSTGANINHFYVQDAWQLMRRLTLNAGVRFEKETIPSFRPDIQKYAFQFGYGDKVSPRLGFAFDVLGNGKMKLSAGWGRYYDWTKFDVARGTFGADLWHVFYRTLDSANFQGAGGGLDATKILAINLDNMPGNNAWVGGSPFRDRRVPGFNTLDKNVKPMSSDAWNAGLEYELFKNFVVSGRYVHTYLNRTIEDMGSLVNGDEVYTYGNPGEGSNQIAPVSGATCLVVTDGVCGYPMPKARRVYNAFELQVSRRFSKGLLFSASYVRSELWGNYSGLQSTDEIRPSTLGAVFGGNQQFAGQIYRPGGNANRYFDLDEATFDAHGRLGLYGKLPTDRPHVFKFYGAKSFKWGTDVGGFYRIMTGTPVTTQLVTANGIPMYVEGRGDMGRTPVFSQTDLVVGHNFKVGEGKTLRFEMNMTNLFNQKTNMFTFDRYNREDLDFAGVDLSSTGFNVDLGKGFDWRGLAAAYEATDTVGDSLRYREFDPRYGLAAQFNTGFEGRLGVKFTF